MPNLEGLSLERCGIGEAGMAALAFAIAGGAAPSCKEIQLSHNPGSAAAVEEAAAQREGLEISQNLSVEGHFHLKPPPRRNPF